MEKEVKEKNSKDDGNAKYFHLRASGRKKKNFISTL
jgi:hypothetical protein